MRAAQNPVDHLVDPASSIPAGIVELITQLPAWLRAAVVVILVLLVVARLCVPPVLRAIDDHLLTCRARNKIEKAEDWVEVLRIRNEPRRMLGRGPTSGERPAASGASGPPGYNRPPEAESSNDRFGDAEDDPP